ncbi:TrkH family potassium uptake protein [Methylovulum psychrotolerans]|uniref:Trk system potassium uptake protein n=1 Tax=Methylovulum psychrotolerans TaxID=1704499 RepID=A0A1Z4BZ24_9GAMM|nr:potassium transporter TrkG [Methylovulum psychrotolerans]ASF46510.1 potassium transporter Trk [Methylovulum psychrotolerans]MBT9097619.1 TrkH family potassium uptake protein [Methylovulum psychrotolerans]POZ53421.1 potassium transporter Trk [Methylovulum psychrotolerans]
MNVIFTIIHIFGLVTMGFSGLMLTCLITALFAADPAVNAFLMSAPITLLAGMAMFLPTLKTPKKVSRQAGFLLVSMTWSLIPVFCTLPLLFYMPQLSFVDAYFEVVSGLTTTGATVLSGIDNLPMSINLWRHELNWIAGMGIIIFAVAILPILGIGGMQLYIAETPGSVKESDLPPRIAQTAKALWMVYAGISLVCILALKLAGMNWFDAICHAFAAMSLGGFSTHDSSVGYFNSLPIEIVLTVFQLIAAINFASHFIALRKRSFKPYIYDMEAKAFLLLVLSSCVLTASVLWRSGTYPDFLTALRHATFNLVTIATDCGFASQDFNQWPIFVPMWMLFLSCLSASSGSTGGGIRMIRTIILMKQARMELFKFIHPAAIRSLRIGDTVINHNIVTSVMGFIFLYFISIVILVFTLLFSGMDFISAFSAIISCFNNAGPGLNQVGPAGNYASLSDFQTSVCTFAMLLGRVQIFSIVILFVPEFWRK